MRCSPQPSQVPGICDYISAGFWVGDWSQSVTCSCVLPWVILQLVALCCCETAICFVLFIFNDLNITSTICTFNCNWKFAVECYIQWLLGFFEKNILEMLEKKWNNMDSCKTVKYCGRFLERQEANIFFNNQDIHQLFFSLKPTPKASRESWW